MNVDFGILEAGEFLRTAKRPEVLYIENIQGAVPVVELTPELNKLLKAVYHDWVVDNIE